MVRVSTKSLMGPKVKILMGQMANTLGSGPWAYVFAASAASAAKCFHAEVWARGPTRRAPLGPLCVGFANAGDPYRKGFANAANPYRKHGKILNIVEFN